MFSVYISGGVAGPAGPAKAGPLFSGSLVSFSDCRDNLRTRRLGQVPTLPVVDPPLPPPCTCTSDLLFAVAWPLLRCRRRLCIYTPTVSFSNQTFHVRTADSSKKGLDMFTGKSAP